MSPEHRPASSLANETAAISFYVTGGTLRQDAPCYVERQADRDLYDALSRSEFCYVLTSRQMGKSSLMVRTTVRLREAGVAVSVLDLTAIGENLTAEQWCAGLLDYLGTQLDLEDALEAFWLAHARLGPIQRWITALREVVLARCPGPVVIFVDEIDVVRSLPFSTDEFFAAIRACYNRRSEDPEFNRLTFCLLGVATPSDLIQDTRATPFNIGRRIELTDFTAAEAAPLAEGLEARSPSSEAPSTKSEQRSSEPSAASRASSCLLHRVLYWTGGHPYLTQRLCQAVAGDTSVTDEAGVDRLCAELFLSPRAQERDDNLLFVRERLLRSEADPASLLDLYAQVRRGPRRSVPDDETNPLVSLLRLSGVVRSVAGSLRVRNRIYERVFDPAWVSAHMPDAELRRQRAAYRRGVWRTAGVAGVIVAVIGGLALTAVDQARVARRASAREAQQRRLAEERERTGREYLYAARLNLAQQIEEAGNVGRAQELLEAQRPEPGQEDLRGWEWRYLWGRCQGDARFTLRGLGEAVNDVAFSPDGKILAAATGSSGVKLRDVATGQEITSLTGHNGYVTSVAFSPDGKLLGSGGEDRVVRLWDVASRRPLASLKGHSDEIHVVAFSPDGKLLASGSLDHTVKLWDLAARRELATLKGYTSSWHSIAFSPDGRLLAMATAEGPVRLWETASWRTLATLRGHMAEVLSVAFSPDGQTMATGSDDDTVRLWDLATKRGIGTLLGHGGAVFSARFSPDGTTLATGSGDTTVKLWDLATRREVATLRGHRDGVASVAFSPDGKSLASGSYDRTVKLWNPATKEATTVLRQQASINALAFSPNGRLLATAHGDGSVRLRDVASRRELATLKGHTAPVGSLAFSPDGTMLASGSEDRTVKLWDLATRRIAASFPGFQGGPWAMAFSPEGKTLAIQGRDAVKLWDLAGPRPTLHAGAPARAVPRSVASFPSDPTGPWGLAFSPDGKTLAATGAQGGVTLWDVASRRAIATLSGAFNSPTFSPDGKILATRAPGGTVKLWDVATQRQVARLKGHRGAGDYFAFSPDGHTLAASSADAIALWNLNIHQEVATLKGHTGPVTSVAFSPDGNMLASGSGDGTVRLWHAATIQEADPLQVVATGADRVVQLQWQPLSYTTAYHVYRGPANARRDQLVRLTPQPVAGTSFTDRGPDLVNGRLQTYAVAPVYRGAAGQMLEGPRVILQASPAAAPPGWMGSSINESGRHGSVAFNVASGKITVRGSGEDIWDTADEFYFTSRLVAGDFQITVKAPGKPTATNEWAKAGLMIRESLDPSARHAMLVITPAHGLAFQWRPVAGDDSEHAGAISASALRLPITLRLTRRGDRIIPEYSHDDGKSFQPVATASSLVEPLPRTVCAGLAITAHDASKISEATFSGLEIRQPVPAARRP